MERILSACIRIARENRGLTQSQLAERCSPPISQAAVAQWESGAKPISESALEKAAAALKCSVRAMLEEGLAKTGAPTNGGGS